MKKKILIVVSFVIAIALFLGINYLYKEKPVEGLKCVSVEVVASDGTSEIYEASTSAMYLRAVLDEIDGITYGETQSGFGPMVTEVNGEIAIYEENGAYWAFFVNGEYCNYGISDQPVNDGDYFKIEYTKA